MNHEADAGIGGGTIGVDLTQNLRKNVLWPRPAAGSESVIASDDELIDTDFQIEISQRLHGDIVGEPAVDSGVDSRDRFVRKPVRVGEIADADRALAILIVIDHACFGERSVRIKA